MVPAASDENRIRFIRSILIRTYPDATIALNYASPWELLVAVILSAQCTDVTVNKVTERLFAKYKTLENYVNADSTEFEKDIFRTGFYHNKTKNILAAAHTVKTRFGGNVPRTMKDLLTLPGVARKTANVVLEAAYGIVEGIAVDTHVARLSQRLRMVDLTKIGGKKLMVFVRAGHPVVDYTKDADPVKIETELMTVFPRDQWRGLTHLLIHHGRAVCTARNPACAACVVRSLCAVSRI